MDISSIINDVSMYSECFSVNQSKNENNTNLSDEAIKLACYHFKEAFSNNDNNTK